MVLSFTSGFIFIFLAIALTIYWVVHRSIKVQNLVLLLLSYVFYGCFDWPPVLFLLGSTVFNYTLGIYLEKLQGKSKKILERFAVVGNLGFLGFLKYFDYFSQNVSDFFSSYDIAIDPVILNLILPIGMSYFTLQVIAYDIEVYRGSLPATRDFVQFACFVAYFPKLIMGPIEAPAKFLSQIAQQRKMSWDKVSGASQLLVLGFFKKIVIADLIGNYISIFYLNPTNYSSMAANLVVVLYVLQIYADFSGYTDIIRGFSRLFGIELTENFQQPYLAQNPRDFWDRWHISLTTWLRNYIYFPLGGNRKGRRRQNFNTIATFVLCLLWHNLAINYALYGFIQGIYLIAHRSILESAKRRNFDLNQKSPRTQKWVRALFCFISFELQNFTFILFRTSSPQAAGIILGVLVVSPMSILSDGGYILQLIIILVFAAILLYKIDIRQERAKTHEIFTEMKWYTRGALYVIMVLTTIGFQFSTYVPFIYQAF